MKNFYPYLLRSAFRIALAVLIFSFPVGLAGAAEPPPNFIITWGSSGSGEGQFFSPYGVAAGGAGDVYVADTANHRIQRFDADGTYLTEWGSSGTGKGQFYYPRGIAVDSGGNVYVADMSNRIKKFDAEGTYLTEWGSSGTGKGQFYYPRGIAVDSGGNVYVADMSNRIKKFDAEGTYLTEWGSSGTGKGQFDYPNGIAVDSADNIYVSDMGDRIQKFDAEGTYLTEWGSSGTGEGQFDYPNGIAVDSADNVYVADTFNHRIQKFDADGNYLTEWGSEGWDDGQFSYPFDIAADGVGNVYVADTFNDRIQKFGNPSIDPGIDIRPWSCRNPLNMRSRGVLPVAILGSEGFDVRAIDVSTVILSLKESKDGAKPIRSRYADVSGPLARELCDRHELGPDGYEDLFLLFKTRDVARTVRTIGELNHGDEVILTIRGSLDGGIQFEGEDSVKIIKKRWKRRRKGRK